ncbi:MAG: urease accessory UreF family protein [Pseudomonadota bacterium]
MATDALTPMPIDTDILTLNQWFSPSYPIGAFSYSHGLEWAAASGAVTDAASLKMWIEGVLQYGAGESDGLFLAASYWAASSKEVSEIDALARAFTASAERLLETTAQGAAFCKATSDVWGADLPELAYPVAVGRAARLEDLPLDLTAQMYLHSFASNIVMAATRLAPVGQTEAQALIHELAPLCAEIAEQTETGDLEALSGTAFLADIQAMQHETQHSRIFRT